MSKIGTPPATVTVENVDDEQLAQAASMLGTQTSYDTVNQALREVVRRQMVDDYITLLKRTSENHFEDPRTTAWQSPNI